MYCITMSVTQNAVCNCEIKSILTYLLTYLLISCKFVFTQQMHSFAAIICVKQIDY